MLGQQVSTCMATVGKADILVLKRRILYFERGRQIIQDANFLRPLGARDMEHDLLHRLFAADGLFIAQISAHSVQISWETGYDEPDTPPRNDESARRCVYHTSPTGHAFHRHHPTSSINQYHFPPYTRPRPKDKTASN